MFTEILERLNLGLTGSALNLAIAGHSWVMPALQTIHILSVAVVLSGVLLINLRIVGWVERSQPVAAVLGRFLWPVTVAVGVLLVTGLLQIAGEPDRAMFRGIFWIKMALLLVAFGLTWSHQPAFAHQGGTSVAVTPSRKALALVALLIWLAVIVAGRWIAYADPWPGAPS